MIFPWAWLGLLVGARVAFQFADVTDDFKAIATLAAGLLAVFGLAFWYLIRGRAPMLFRVEVAAAPFVFLIALNTFFELRHAGDGSIVGLHRRGAEKRDQRLDRVEATRDQALADWAPGEHDYPRFLGDGPWAEASGPALATDWTASPPEELWRVPVGAGWSSFAIYGPYAITQEQRGVDELVVCRATATGEVAWSHADVVRFDPEDFAGQMGRAGPRATPTIVGERVYTQGATGLVNCLDALTGEVVWRVDTVEAFGVDVPVWGKSGSPLFVAAAGEAGADLVVVNVGAPTGATEESYDASLVAFDAATGEVVWKIGWRQTSYASPALVTLHGERVVLQTSDDVLTGHAVADGRQLFEAPWPGQSDNMPSCSQPIPVGRDQLLMTKGYGHGSSLLGVEREADGWSINPLWAPPVQPVLQTKYSNVVVRDGYAYGLNGTILQCVDIETGQIAWRKRRRPSFDFGQVLLAGAQLLVMTEKSGEVVMVDADPERYRERGALQALEEGEVCWNNPALAGDLLLVRNAVEAAAYRLPLAGIEPASDASLAER